MQGALPESAKTFLARAGYLGYFIAIPIYAYKVAQKTDYTDFGVYYKAVSLASHGNWSAVYDLGDGASPFRYAPVILPLLRPLAELGPDAARLAWFFVQVVLFAGGFWLLYRLYPRLKRSAFVAVGLSLLMSLRLIVDTFSIGQVSSLLFFLWCLGLFCLTRGLGVAAVASLWLPAGLKIGPAILFAFPALRRRPGLLKSVGAFGLTSLCLAATLVGYLVFETRGQPELAEGRRWGEHWHFVSQLHQELWKAWAHVVEMDSSYYDAAHYGSQSLKSFLLRLFNLVSGLGGFGWLTRNTVSQIHTVASLLGCGWLLVFWWRWRAIGPDRRIALGLSFSLGVMAVLLFMPETFKYSMTGIAVPLFFLWLLPRRSWISRLALVWVGATISFAAKDFLPDSIFFGIQQASLPFFGLVLLTIAVFYEAWTRSIRRPWRRERGAAALRESSPDVASRLQQLPWTADDWGLSPGVNQGILHLAGQGVVRRVSMMANTQYLREGLAELQKLSNQGAGVHLGLHFNLTYGRPLTSSTLFRHESAGRFLLRSAYLSLFQQRRWRDAILAEFDRQYAALMDCGIRVAYLDSHHHAHLGFGVLEAIAPRLKALKEPLALRIPYDPTQWWHPTKWLLNLLSVRLMRRLESFGLVGRSDSLLQVGAVIYPDSGAFESRQTVLAALHSRLQRSPLTGWKAPMEILCHPAAVDDLASLEFQDSYQAQRVQEYITLLELGQLFRGRS